MTTSTTTVTDSAAATASVSATDTPDAAGGADGRARVVVLQPDARVPADRIPAWLAEEGIDCRVVELWREPVPSVAGLGAGGVILLGGRASALDHDAYPWLRDVHALLDACIADDVPVLGICLGHQILADALGGSVVVGHPTAGEEGARTVTPSAAGEADPLFRGLGGRFRAAESHNDVVTAVPRDATVLASSEACAIQAFRVGSAVGVQFHPEASPELMAAWTEGDGGDGPAMAAEMRAVDDEVAAAGRSLIAAFAGVARHRARRGN